jgi:hypothetical protein
MNIIGVALVVISSALVTQSGDVQPVAVDYCELVKEPHRYSWTLVAFKANLVQFESGEWGLDRDCFTPTLLVLPDTISPRPPFELAATPAVESMIASQRERYVLFRATFVGRFDLAKKLEGAGTTVTYGKSKSSIRLVLKEVLDPERIKVLRR